MDVKQFHKSGFIKLEDGIYKGVTGITNDYARTISEGVGRPELLRDNSLLHQLLEDNDKELIEKFPFDAINLDYCNHIYDDENMQYISSNLKDINKIIELQNKTRADKFALFITTRTDSSRDSGGFAKHFMDDLVKRIELNVTNNSNFESLYHRIFNNLSSDDVINHHYSKFITIGIVKLISMELASRKYSIKNCDIYWLRRRTSIARDFLHIALLVERGEPILVPRPPKYVSQMGTARCLESGAVIILDKIIKNRIYSLSEQADYKRCESIYSKDIEALKKNFELDIPKPTN
jgi:translation initiation factor 2 beta subunit (eIF-2beta)/eIF-5